MTLNPYQNDLLSSYLEKSAGRLVTVRPPKGGTGGTLVVSGNPKLGVRPLAVNPNKAPSIPTTSSIAPRRSTPSNKAPGIPAPPTRNIGLASGDGPYPLVKIPNDISPLGPYTGRVNNSGFKPGAMEWFGAAS